MSYIGVEPTGGTFDKQVITGDGSNTTFNLDFPVARSCTINGKFRRCITRTKLCI